MSLYVLLAAVVGQAYGSATAAEGASMRLSEADNRLAQETRQKALETKPSEVSIFWDNAASGYAGAVTPLRTYRTTTGYYCRTYRQRLYRPTVGVETVTATACRDDSGIWRTISED